MGYIMEDENIFKISVRDLVEFVLSSGDLTLEFSGSTRNVDAIRIHQKLQKAGGENYKAEVYLKHQFNIYNQIIELSGRADGIIKEENDVVIDEIKTTSMNIDLINEDYNIVHWAQAKCYAYIYCIDNNIENISVQLTYCNIDTYDIKKLVNDFSVVELQEFFEGLIEKYIFWAEKKQNFYKVRDKSIQTLEFPFDKFRTGQRNFSISAYRVVRDGGKLFAQAPTGTGKTIATLFPAVKAMGEGYAFKIFYLTAKTITRTIAENALEIMIGKGLKIKSITLTAKDKICFSKDRSCNPDDCIYARGYYDRLKSALKDILEVDFYTRDVIEKYALKYEICPFEFSLDLSLWSDVIICDYNYLFDPRVSLKRFFLDNKEEYCFLVDEAHNLVDRARDMYSSEIYKKKFLDMKKKTQYEIPKIKKYFNKINKFFLDMREQLDGNNNLIATKDPPKDVVLILKSLIKEIEKWLVINRNNSIKEEVMDFYFEIFNFIKVYELYDDRYITYIEKNNEDIKLKLFCIDPSFLISEALKKGKSTVFFSATLTPLTYFKKILGGDEESKSIILPSPFPKENLCIMINKSISTKYKDRETTFDEVYKCILSSIEGKNGNYLVFFPSYQYMIEIHKKFNEQNGVKLIIQNSDMSELEKEKFLLEFSTFGENTLLGFAVLGGIFSEGIDLSGEKLSGAIIVGVGLPKICDERDLISTYFNRDKESGFKYAYIYPGINKVLQAAGRVIRTENDRGIIMLIDERYRNNQYKSLLPIEWSNYKSVYTCEQISHIVHDFWK